MNGYRRTRVILALHSRVDYLFRILRAWIASILALYTMVGFSGLAPIKVGSSPLGTAMGGANN